MSRSTLRVVQAWQDAVNRGDVAAVREITADRVELAGPRGTTTMAAEDLGAWMVRSGFTATARRWFRGDDAVVVEQDATWRDPASGEQTGRAVVATSFRVAGARVTSIARHDALDAALGDVGLTLDDEVDSGV